MEAERRFRAMGTDVHVVVAGQAGGDVVGLLDRAQREVESLDRRWTRFRDDSELSAINAAAGDLTVLPRDTFAVIELAVAGWRETDGAFDPTVLAAVAAAGYDRSFELIGAGASVPRPVLPAVVPGCDGVVLDPILSAVTLPPGVALDLGGVAKGHTADRVAATLVAGGACGACVNVGGDIRVEGTPPAGGWVVSVDAVGDGDESARVVLPPGAGIATSTTRRRRWSTEDGEAHHLIDPATGVSARSDVITATVVAGTAAWAEIVATALVVRGTAGAPALLARTGAAALVMTTAGETVSMNGFDGYAA